jgi:hypothetical protein
MRSLILALLIVTGIYVVYRHADGDVLFDFEHTKQNWSIPQWAAEQGDCTGMLLEVSPDKSSSRDRALKLTCEVPGDSWSSAVIEYENEMDLSWARVISVDIFVPSGVWSGKSRGRIALITGEAGWWMEMRGAVRIETGEWSNISAGLREQDASLWGNSRGDGFDLKEDLAKVRKIVIRVEFDGWHGSADMYYNGPVYVDNIRIE